MKDIKSVNLRLLLNGCDMLVGSFALIRINPCEKDYMPKGKISELISLYPPECPPEIENSLSSLHDALVKKRSSEAAKNVLKNLYDSPDKPVPALKADQYGDTPLSETIEDGDIEEVKKLIMAKDLPMTDAELLTNIGIAVTNAEIRDKLGIDKKTASNIFNGSLYQLTLLGEDISELMDAYNFKLEEFGL